MSNLWDLSHIQPQPSSVLDGDTIAAMFWNAVAQRGPDVWLRKKDLGIWRSWTWQQTGEAVREIAGGLMQLGFAAGDTASILSNTVVEWVMADLAVLSCGGVSNGIYPTDAASQVQYLCEDSSTRILFAEDDEQLDKVLEVREQLPFFRRGPVAIAWREGFAAMRMRVREHHALAAAHPHGRGRRRGCPRRRFVIMAVLAPHRDQAAR